MNSEILRVNSPNVKYTEKYIEADYDYNQTKVEVVADQLLATPMTTRLHIRTKRQVPKLGLMLVGWGGNNGSTVTAAILANKMKLTWNTKEGKHKANWINNMTPTCSSHTIMTDECSDSDNSLASSSGVQYQVRRVSKTYRRGKEPDIPTTPALDRFGSLTQSSTVRLGTGPDGEDIFIPMKQLLPMVEPDNLILDGWDISSMNLADAMERSQVIDWNLQAQLKPHMVGMKPRPSIFSPDFIAANQASRVDNTITGKKWDQVEQIRKDIRDFRAKEKVDKVIVLWTANTERFCNIIEGVHDNADSLVAAIKANYAEISPSTLFAVAAILEGCTYINGAPQNTFVPGCIELAERHNTFIAGDDFKSGQTKLKSVLVDFLVNAGIKPVSIVSYNHLGNNDGKNLSAAEQFHSKEISKSNVVDDMVASNSILYGPNEKPDHCVVIKYVPYVGDSKRAMDEYTSELMLGGHNTIVIHNTCEDSLLASPIILDLALLAELCSRIEFKVAGETDKEYSSFHSVLSILSYLCKAPLVPPGTPVVNALNKQRSCIENVMRACLSLPPENNMLLEHKLESPLLSMGIPRNQLNHNVETKKSKIYQNGIVHA